MPLQQMLFSFSGRINRAPFWLYALAMTVVFMILIGLIFWLFGTVVPTPDDPRNYELSPIGWIVGGLLYLVMIWMSLALQAKRWHDRDKSAWWILIGLVPVIGGIWALVETGFLPGTPGPNRFGHDPLDGV